MPPSARAKISQLTASLSRRPPVPSSAAERGGGESPGSPRLHRWAVQLGAVQERWPPLIRDKALVVFLADTPGSDDGSRTVPALASGQAPLAQLAARHQVRLALTDLALAGDFRAQPWAGRLLRHRLSADLAPAARVWAALDAGVKVATWLRGRDTDLFGVGPWRAAPDPGDTVAAVAARAQWEIAAAAGLLLGAAHLNAATVVAGPWGQAAARLATELCPAAAAFVMDVTPLHQWLAADVAGSAVGAAEALTAVTLGLNLCQHAAVLASAVPTANPGGTA